MDNGILAAGAQDIDFMIHGLFSYKIFGHEVWITTSHVCILIIMLILIAFSFIVKYKMKAATEVPGGFQNVVELMVEKLDGVVDGVMGKNAPKLVNYISTIFIFILMSNISGLFGLRPPTADYGTTLRLFANVLSGTVMMALVYGLLSKIAIVWPAALHVYFDLFSGAIQTYVFCMLTMTYVNQQMETE